MSFIHCQTDRRHFCVYTKFFIIFIRRAYYAKNKISGIHFTLITSGCMILSWAFIMSPSTPANFRLLPSNTHCILSHWNGSSGFSVHSSLPPKRPNTSHSAWQNQLTDQSSSSSASRLSQSVQWCRL